MHALARIPHAHLNKKKGPWRMKVQWEKLLMKAQVNQQQKQSVCLFVFHTRSWHGNGKVNWATDGAINEYQYLMDRWRAWAGILYLFILYFIFIFRSSPLTEWRKRDADIKSIYFGARTGYFSSRSFNFKVLWSAGGWFQFVYHRLASVVNIGFDIKVNMM